MSTYLVAGAAGFIGSRVSEMLLDAGHSVVGVDNLNHAYDVRMKKHRVDKLLPRQGFSFHITDISDPKILDALDYDFDGVINLAARAGVRASVRNPWIYMNDNVGGTLNLLELCKRRGIDKFVLASTSSVYGEDVQLPTPESAASDKPLQPYAASKKGAEVLAHSYHHLHNIDVSVVRYFTVYGPAGRPDMAVFRFCKWIWEGEWLRLNGSGEQTRGFTYVDDIARGTIAALKPVGYEIFNLGGHEAVSINELIRTLENRIGKRAYIENHDKHCADMDANRADASKARSLLGWEAEVSFSEGIGKTVAWYERERDWAKDITT